MHISNNIGINYTFRTVNAQRCCDIGRILTFLKYQARGGNVKLSLKRKYIGTSIGSRDIVNLSTFRLERT